MILGSLLSVVGDVTPLRPFPLRASLPCFHKCLAASTSNSFPSEPTARPKSQCQLSGQFLSGASSTPSQRTFRVGFQAEVPPNPSFLLLLFSSPRVSALLPTHISLNINLVILIILHLSFVLSLLLLWHHHPLFSFTGTFISFDQALL